MILSRVARWAGVLLLLAGLVTTPLAVGPVQADNHGGDPGGGDPGGGDPGGGDPGGGDPGGGDPGGGDPGGGDPGGGDPGGGDPGGGDPGGGDPGGGDPGGDETFNYNIDSDGDWHSGGSWDQGLAPDAANHIVYINRGGADPLITFSATSGTRQIKSLMSTEAIQLTGGTLEILETANLSGSFTLAGGTLQGGQITTAGIDVDDSSGNGLDGVTLNGDLLLQSDHSQVNVSGGLTLNGTADLSGDAATLIFNGGTQTLTASPGQTATVQMGDAESFMASYYFGTLTLDETVTVEGQGEIGYQGDTVINEGLIHANVIGETLEISPGTFTNSGTLRVSGGAALVLEGDWDNQGAVELDEGVLVLGGTFTTADLNQASMTRGASTTVQLTGDLDNAGGVLSEIGEITLNGGSITDGTSLVDIRAGTNPGSWGADVLDGVTLNGDLLLQSDHSQVNVSGGLTLNGTADLSGDAARLRFAGGTQTLTASPGQTATVQMGDAESFMAMFYGGQLTLDETVTVEGQGEIGYQGETIINQGTIHANVSGETLEISPGTFTNSGTLRVSGGAALVLEGDWDNQGAVELDEGVLVLGGTFTTADLNQASMTRGALTAVQLTGDLDNAGGVLQEIGTIQLVGSGTNSSQDYTTITGGTLDVDIEVTGNTYEKLDGVTLNGNLNLTDSDDLVRIENGLTLNGTADLSGDAATLIFNGGTQTLTASPGQTATVQMGDAESFMASYYFGTLTLDETVTVEGQGEIGYQGDTVINEGLIHANVIGETLEISPGTFTNSGTLRVSGGAALVLEGDWDNQGAVELDEGVLVLGGTFTTADLNQASMTRGASTTVQLTGDLDNAGGVLSEIGEITLNGGSITDGTSLVDIRAGTNPGSWGADVLDGVTLNGDLLLQSDHSQVNVSGGLTLNGTADLSGDAARLRFAGGTQTLTASPGQTATVQMGDAESFMAMFYGGQLTLDETVTVEGQGEIGYQGETIINEGTIHANGSGETLEISPGTFTNSGTLRVSGGATLVLEGDWDSQGAVELDEGVLVLGGTFTTAGLNQASLTRGALTAVQLTGDLDNAGGVLSEIGEITLNGGSITDGTSLVDIRAGTNPGSWAPMFSMV